ncbi:hypothetical protein EV05_0119 [Prochlorococcus sp. MIT 0601]|nr:hypothetical protein EV05_0119 [Prochlorococcus sp. MIT 0601]
MPNNPVVLGRMTSSAVSSKTLLSGASTRTFKDIWIAIGGEVSVVLDLREGLLKISSL